MNDLQTDYFLDGDKVISERTGNDVIHYTYDIDGTLISALIDQQEYFYIRNLQGDIVKLVDEAGRIIVEYYYNAWGNILSSKEYNTDGTEKANLDIAIKNPHRYRGYRYDVETGLYYLNSRYYNPEIGRFLNADGLIGETGDILGHNMYSYTKNNPVMMVDPSGYLPTWAEWVIGVGVIVGLGIATAVTDGTAGVIWCHWCIYWRMGRDGRRCRQWFYVGCNYWWSFRSLIVRS